MGLFILKLPYIILLPADSCVLALTGITSETLMISYSGNVCTGLVELYMCSYT